MRQAGRLFALVALITAFIGVSSHRAAAQTTGSFQFTGSGTYTSSVSAIPGASDSFSFNIPVSSTLGGKSEAGTLEGTAVYSAATGKTTDFSFEFLPSVAGATKYTFGPGSGTVAFGTTNKIPTFTITGAFGTGKSSSTFDLNGDLASAWALKDAGCDKITSANCKVGPAPEMGSVLAFGLLLCGAAVMVMTKRRSPRGRSLSAA